MKTKQTIKALLICGTYGELPQKLKCCEELSELSAAIMHHINKGGHEEEIMDELADVYIMLEQLKHMDLFDIEDLEEKIEFKLDRQLARIKCRNLDIDCAWR